MNRLPKGLQMMVQRLLATPGYTIRKVAIEVAISKNTVMLYRNSWRMPLPDCPCGKQSGHKGWCSFRFTRSPARQAFMLLIPRRKSQIDHKSFLFVSQFSSLAAKNFRSARCSEKGCPFPILGQFTICPFHMKMFSQEESLTGSGLDWTDTHSDRDSVTSPLRVATRWEMENYERLVR